MECNNCQVKMEEKFIKRSVTLNGEWIEFNEPHYVCYNCGIQVFHQVDTMKAINDAYNKRLLDQENVKEA